MSCGEPHATPCSEVLGKLYAYIDGELEEANCADIRVHLDECRECLQEYGLEGAVKKLVARHCGCDPVPEDLRGKVLSRLAAARADLQVREAGVET
ncbi:mycothiol system anti-sigma-R factor [Marinitenerispora sediminis]|uniref:Mycothiol system anti-sigma-R factor n=1 Tax=Marinitenerispora sediminis TaxID=1931232 RepID=A0A368T8U5_9ACTN|nr:mycothiol system anti-sigma-R factor [Marinitenerispora sediminis]RCV50619.1 mycothiol system anti-sigma-R factor [Marinitenerispora sediminis]RCV51321.1 mycothiol system anti-sigma-R factor [Marinitenerispora sediminis]RCV60447.1 mycothiol system anti-sigma-R factor [Marinitenerispora sediminis]